MNDQLAARPTYAQVAVGIVYFAFGALWLLATIIQIALALLTTYLDSGWFGRLLIGAGTWIALSLSTGILIRLAGGHA